MDAMISNVKFADKSEVSIIAEFIYHLIQELADGSGPDREAVLSNTREVFSFDA